MSSLKKANQFFREKKYKEAIGTYMEICQQPNSLLQNSCLFNIALILYRTKFQRQHIKLIYQKSFNLDHNIRKELCKIIKKPLKTYPVKISIIVPVYNSENYLRQCLESILNQNIKNIEIIIINDGSIDNSTSIINDFEKKDSRIKSIYNTVGSGNPGTPRNQGIDIATGEYITFVDSDDYIEKDYYSNMLEKIGDNSPDIIFSSGFYNINEKSRNLKKYHYANFNNQKKEGFKTHESFMIWDKLFRTDFIKTLKIYLGETKAAVDVPFIFKAYYYALYTIQKDNVFGYNYRRETENSVTVNWRMKTSCDFELEAYQSVYDWLIKESVNSAYKKNIKIKQVNSLLYTLKVISQEHFEKFHKKAKKILLETESELIREYAISHKKWWLFKEFEFIRNNKSQESYDYLESKKKAKKIEDAVKFKIPGKKGGIIFFPCWTKSNPYQSLFYEAIHKKFEFSIEGYSQEMFTEELLKRQKKEFDFLHFHWMHVFIDNMDELKFEKFMDNIKIAKKLGYKILYTAHNILSHESKNKEIEKNLRNKFLKQVDTAIVHGNYAKEKLIKEFSFPAEKIQEIKHGHYCDVYQNNTNTEQSRAYLNIPGDHFVYLFLGNIRAYKGVSQLISSFKEVQKENNKSTLIIAGRVMDNESKNIINDNIRGGENIIFHPGFVKDDDIQHYYNAANICVLPYRNILTSGAALLSLTFKKPVIAPNKGTLPEYIQQQYGLLFNDSYSLTSCMKDALHESSHFNLNDVNKKFSWDICISNIIL